MEGVHVSYCIAWYCVVPYCVRSYLSASVWQNLRSWLKFVHILVQPVKTFLNKLCLNEPFESNTLIIHRSRISPLIGTNLIISLHHSSFDIVLRGINKSWSCSFGYNTSRYSGRGCRQERECMYPLKYLGAGVEQLLTCLLCVCVYVYNLITGLITPCEKLSSSLKVSNGGDGDDINLKLAKKIRSVDATLKNNKVNFAWILK